MFFPHGDRMSREELRAGVSLASVFALRMLGLFLILPVFAVHAHGIPGGANLTLVGVALGAYGLTQALFQIPFGVASDRFGRKPVIIAGLVVFAVGSVVAALAHDVYVTIIGRCLQGAGAISAAVTALAADLTREEHRTKVMAMIGGSIGVVFAASLVLAPLLYAHIGMEGIFFLTGALAVGAIAIVVYVIPPAPARVRAPEEMTRFMDVLRDTQLARLNFGICVIHTTQMAMFVVLPAAMLGSGNLPLAQHWKVYLPVVLLSFVLMLPVIVFSEKKARVKPVFLAAIGLLVLTQLGFAAGVRRFWSIVCLLLPYFVVFNLLEAMLPSLVSRMAPPGAKGAALGIYNTTQSVGLFLGGALGGAAAHHFGAQGVFLCCALAGAAWFAVALSTRLPPLIALREYAIQAHIDLQAIRPKLASLPGVREAVVVPEKRMAYLKVNLERWDEARLRSILGGET
jgi:MFS family permease